MNQSIENKYIFISPCFYQIVPAQIPNCISLRNVMTGEYARHSDGVIHNHEYSQDPLFLLDSAFFPRQHGNHINLFCVNQGLAYFYLATLPDGGAVIVDNATTPLSDDSHHAHFELLDKAQIFVRENDILGDVHAPKVVALGSSATEIFDYVFGDHPDYLPFWASSWSARGLRKDTQQKMQPYQAHLSKLSKDSVFLLHFGTVDVDFNLPFKMTHEGFYDIPRFVDEMAEGILALRNHLRDEYGFQHIYATFTAPTVVLPDDCWRFDDVKPISNLLKAKVLWDCAAKLAQRDIEVLNCLPDLAESVDNPICKQDYVRDYPDHHINYVAAQDIVYEKIRHIPNMLPQRAEKHTELYPHLRYDVLCAEKNNLPKPRTCR